MKINFNTSAIVANNNLSLSEKRLTVSTERLSSGYKINHAKDNPSGLAISKKMNSQIRGLNDAAQNAGNGISVIETAEGALSEVQDMVQRMNELAVKSSTGSITDSDREAIQAEVNQLKQEVTRIVKDTEFNGKAILDGEFDLRGYSDNANVGVNYYSDEVLAGKYGITALTIQRDAEGNIDPSTTITLDTTGGAGKRPFPAGCTVDYEGDTITIKGIDNFELKLVIPDSVVDNTALGAVELDLTGIGGMKVQVGSNEGQVLDVRVPKVSLKNMGIEDADFTTQASATEALNKMSGAIDYVSEVRSRLGAYQNRLDHTISSLEITSENMTSAYSRIVDVDMAAEMTEYTKYQVLTQAGTSMLTQANERPSQLLQLLQ